MTKRIGIVFFLFALIMGALALQLMRLPMMVTVSGNHGRTRVVVDRSRGAILDRNGVPLVHAQPQAFAAVKPTQASDQFLRGALNYERYALLEPRLARGNLLSIPIEDAVAGISRISIGRINARIIATASIFIVTFNL